ncbi:hypothetical protein [Paraclostridium tenue]|uniref:Erythromycin esterase n=1 Tax=Paraclostridium tenue TaxID=1737 RepID=A0ABP3XBY3_9FIRM
MKKIKVLGTVLLFMLIPILLIVYLSTPYKIERKYLRNNKSIINLDDIDDFSGLELIKEDLKNKKVVFTGEDHSLNKDNLFKIKMIKYLKKEIGLNYCLDEIPYTSAYFINKYLETGNENILKRVFKNSKDTAFCNKDDYRSYKQLYEFNQTLPKDKRIKILGPDIEHNPKTSLDYIINIIKNKDLCTTPLKELIINLKNHENSSVDKVNLKTCAEKLLKDITKNEDIYKDIFKEEFENFSYVLNNIQQMCISYLQPHKSWNIVRDNYIYENFKYLDSKINNAKYFGQWGGFHILQETFYDEFNKNKIDFFASLLNKDKKYKGKILSIHYGYQNSGVVDKITSSQIDLILFDDYINSQDDAILFKLNNKFAPFSSNFIWPFEHKFKAKKDQYTSDYIQYLLMIKDSKVSKPLYK